MERSTPSPARILELADAKLKIADPLGGGFGGALRSVRREMEKPDLDQAARAAVSVLDDPAEGLAHIQRRVRALAWRSAWTWVQFAVILPRCSLMDPCDRHEPYVLCPECWRRDLVNKAVEDYCEMLLERTRQVAHHPTPGCEGQRRLRRIGLAVALWAPNEFLFALSLVDRSGALAIPQARVFSARLADDQRQALRKSVEARLNTIVDKKVLKKYKRVQPGTVFTADDWVTTLLVDAARSFGGSIVADAALNAERQYNAALHNPHAVRPPTVDHPVAREFARRLLAWSDLSTKTTFQQFSLVLSANADSWSSFTRSLPGAPR